MSANRREFLKLTSTLGAALPFSRHMAPRRAAAAGAQNVIVLLFDTWSAMNVSLYGYERDTTPNLRRIAEKAHVYHNHFAGGHETYSGTCALLTGAENWHAWQGMNANKAIQDPFKDANLFGAFEDYHRVAYTHNPVAEQVLNFLSRHIDHYQPRQSLYLNSNYWLNDVFGEDFDIAGLSWVRVVASQDDGYANSLYIGKLYEAQQARMIEGYRDSFPLGPPVIQEDNYFILEDAINWIQEQTPALPQPYLGYFHLLPPHAKYKPRSEFFNHFLDDDFFPLLKPGHPLANRANEDNLNRSRKLYDEYMLYVDAELGRLYDSLESSGQLENTWLVITSDHGEMFERGIYGHRQPTFHQPVIHVPLLIFPPGDKQRQDIYTPTSALDLAPTLLHLTGHDIPPQMDGVVLPPFNESLPNERAIYAATWEADRNEEAPRNATVMLVRDRYKLMLYNGYEDLPGSAPYEELYDFIDDPQELNELSQAQPELVQEMQRQVSAHIAEATAK